MPYWMPGEIPSTPDERNLALVAHLLPIVTGFIGPLVILLVKGDSPFVSNAAKGALAFSLLIGVSAVVLTFSMFFLLCFAFLLIPVAMGLLAAQLVYPILGAIAANRGECYRYPISSRFLN
jgi:uncharacterized Tic20 family protein